MTCMLLCKSVNTRAVCWLFNFRAIDISEYSNTYTFTPCTNVGKVCSSKRSIFYVPYSLYVGSFYQSGWIRKGADLAAGMFERS